MSYYNLYPAPCFVGGQSTYSTEDKMKKYIKIKNFIFRNQLLELAPGLAIIQQGLLF